MGGVIYLDGPGPVDQLGNTGAFLEARINFTNSQLPDSQADRCGVMYSSMTNATITVQSTSITGSSATAIDGIGGVMCLDKSASAVMTVQGGSTISSSSAEQDGGCFHLSSKGSFTISLDQTSSVSDSSAGGDGGVFWVGEDATAIVRYIVYDMGAARVLGPPAIPVGVHVRVLRPSMLSLLFQRSNGAGQLHQCSERRAHRWKRR